MDKQAARYSRTFKEVRKIILPSPCLNKAYKQMRVAAMQRREGMALFAGIEENNIFHIIETLIPERGTAGPDEAAGLQVGANELPGIRQWLQENEFDLIAQIHSAPRQFYPDPSKVVSSMINITGGISIVVPDFALGPTNPETWIVYRLSACNKWIELDKNEICYLFEITY